MTCGTCTHWRLVGELGRAGFGQCDARAAHLRETITTPEHATCRIGKHAPAPRPQEGQLL